MIRNSAPAVAGRERYRYGKRQRVGLSSMVNSLWIGRWTGCGNRLKQS
jgi:hypothetical protein